MNTETFADKLQRNLAIRKRELSRIRLAVHQSMSTEEQANWLCRAAILLSYAHWEGFVKEASQSYIKLICARSIRIDRLHLSLQAASLRGQFKRASQTEKWGYLGTVLDEIDQLRCKDFKVSADRIVDTESNLSSKAFNALVESLGLIYMEFYQTRQAFIDEKLLHARNKVAHGELAEFNDEDAYDRIDGVLELLDTYINQLIDSARDEAYFANRNGDPNVVGSGVTP